jgi:hypothetical protein
MSWWPFVGVGAGMEKRRAWVQRGLGSSTTIQPVASWGLGELRAGQGQQQVTPPGPPASAGWRRCWPSWSGGGPSARS